jgi:hypothetical protein
VAAPDFPAADLADDGDVAPAGPQARAHLGEEFRDRVRPRGRGSRGGSGAPTGPSGR